MKEYYYVSEFDGDSLLSIKFNIAKKSFHGIIDDGIMRCNFDISDYRVVGDFDCISAHFAHWYSKTSENSISIFVSQYSSIGWDVVYKLIVGHVDSSKIANIIRIPYDIRQDIIYQSIYNYEDPDVHLPSIKRSMDEELNFIKLAYDSIKYGRIVYNKTLADR